MSVDVRDDIHLLAPAYLPRVGQTANFVCAAVALLLSCARKFNDNLRNDIMCLECGCGEIEHSHTGHSHAGHSHAHDHAHDHGEVRTLTLGKKILEHNDQHAAENRAWLAKRGVVAINIISSPGTGKTTLLERTLEILKGEIQCAVIAGDQRSDNDAKRLRDKGAPVCQIETGNACHLDAVQVGDMLPEVVRDGVKLLFIENVGNLICPSAFDLGENFKVALLSSTEGEDKPVKYPALFSRVPVAVLTKMDLVPHLEWDVARCRDCLRQVRPGVFIFELSARTGDGMDAWIEYLKKLVA